MSEKNMKNESNTIGPGTRLRMAREQSGYSIDDVATRLRLNSDVIADIEQDCYNEMPGVMFVKGYLRGYSKLMGMDQDETIQAFDRLQVQDIKNDRPIYSIDKQQVTSRHPSVRMVTYTIVFGFIFLAAYWWHASRTDIMEATQPNILMQSNSANIIDSAKPTAAKPAAKVKKTLHDELPFESDLLPAKEVSNKSKQNLKQKKSKKSAATKSKKKHASQKRSNDRFRF